MSQEQNKTISGNVKDVYTSASQEYKENRMPRVGQTVEFEDGRKFVFCSFAAPVGVGRTVGQAAPESAVVSVVADSYAVVSGTRKIAVTLAGAVANEYAGGMVLDESTGTAYKIKSNTKADDVTDILTVVVYDALVASIAAGVDLQLTKDKTSGVVEGTATNSIVGFSLAVQAAGDYAWVQYQGIGAIEYTSYSVGAAFMADIGGAVAVGTGAKPILGSIVAPGALFDLAYFEIQGGC